MKVLFVALVLVPGMAWATPPPAGSAAALELDKFTAQEQKWIAEQHDLQGRWCCTLGDFDFVTIRDVNGELQVKAKHPDMSRGIPSGWVPTEENRKVDLTGQKNMPDVVAAWFFKGRVQCLIAGSAF